MSYDLLLEEHNADTLKTYLVSNITDVNVQDKQNGWTPLMFAANCCNDIEKVKLLLAAQANVDMTNNNGETALLLAIKNEWHWRQRGHQTTCVHILSSIHMDDIRSQIEDTRKNLHNLVIHRTTLQLMSLIPIFPIDGGHKVLWDIISEYASHI